MQGSHDFDFSASPAFHFLTDLLSERFSLPAAEAASEQPAFEQDLRRAMAAVEREVHVADFTRLDVEVEGIVVNEKRYRLRAEKTVGTYDTIAGTIEVERSVYRQRGGHGGETICPLEMRLGLVDGRWTLRAAEIASRFMAAGPSKESAELLGLTGGRASLCRLAPVRSAE